MRQLSLHGLLAGRGLEEAVVAVSSHPPLTIWLAGASMLGTMLVFGSNFAVSRYAIQHGLTPYDVVFLRIAPAGLLLLPVFLRGGLRRPLGIGWGRAAALACLSGAPMTVLMNFAVSFAPAAHGAAISPGMVTVVGVVTGAFLAGRLPPRLTRIGLALVVGGLVTVAAAGGTSGSAQVFLGDAIFFVCGLCWGFYPLLLHRWRVNGIDGAAACAVMSLPFVPIYLLFLEPRLLGADPALLAVQAIYQGVVNSIGALWLWGYGVRVLGLAGTQLFPPLIPVIGALIAIPVLGEWPGPLQIVGIGAIVTGLALAARGNRSPRT